ncbi:MAG: CidA/LrgA family protein [Synechococcus sp.]
MTFLNGITVLLLYQLLGEVAALVLGLPIPGPVLGMTFLFLTLRLHGKVPTSLDSASNHLLHHFSLLFIPAGVGVMVHFDRMANEWLPISVALLLSTIVTLAGTAAMMSIANSVLSKRAPNDA